MKLYTYVIATDAGSAPNYDPPFTTLAICKPRIRHGARIGDVVLAFTGSSVSPEPHAVCWAGVVTEKLTFAEYWQDSRFAGKKPGRSSTPDNIYRPRPGGFELDQVPNNAHNAGSVSTDLGGHFVLVCGPAWRFGAGGPILPGEFGHRMPKTARRNHRRHVLTTDAWRWLKTWLDQEQKRRGILTASAIAKNCRPSRSMTVLMRRRKPRC